MASLPALSCVDDLAGETVLTACEKSLFASAESAAAAIAYAGSMITRLVALGDVATANRNLTPEMEALRRAVERDRYGLMAYVLAARDHCTAAACPAFRSLANTKQVVSNMDERVYEGLVVRYSGSWNAPGDGAAGYSARRRHGRAALGIAAGKPTTCRLPVIGVDPAGQHHDAGTGRAGIRRPASPGDNAGRHRAAACGAPDGAKRRRTASGAEKTGRHRRLHARRRRSRRVLHRRHRPPRPTTIDAAAVAR